MKHKFFTIFVMVLLVGCIGVGASEASAANFDAAKMGQANNNTWTVWCPPKAANLGGYCRDFNGGELAWDNSLAHYRTLVTIQVNRFYVNQYWLYYSYADGWLNLYSAQYWRSLNTPSQYG